MYHSLRIPRRLVFVFVFVYLSFAGFSQPDDYSNPDRCKERRGLEYGGIAGFYMAGKSTAGFYSGKPGNENNVNYVFRNTYWYNEIYQLLGAYDTVFVREYPEEMKYDPAFSFGVFARYDLNCNTGIILQFSYAKLRAKDVVTVEVDPKEYLTEPDIRLCSIYGTEERNLLDLGIVHAFGKNPVSRFLIGAGVNMNNSLVKEHMIQIGTKSYNLVNVYGNNNYIPGGNQQSYEIRQGGIGFGLYGTIGGRFEFSPAVALEPGFTFYYKKIAIDPNSGFVPQMNFFVRLCFRDLLTFSE